MKPDFLWCIDLKPVFQRIWSFLFESHLGSLEAIRRYRKEIKNIPTVEESIDTFCIRWPKSKPYNNSQPIFIFSAGWRSGSTLLQRLLMSSQQILVWGEPYGHTGLIDSLLQPLKGITSSYPPSKYFANHYLDHNDSDKIHSVLSHYWVANLYPDPYYLVESHISFLTNLFEKPAREKGFKQWGIKAVRLDIDCAIYLNWLFPQAKFLFLYRNPYHTYTSYRGSYWYNIWPTDPVYTPKRFGQHWKTLVEGYMNKHQKVNSLLIKYEDLCDGNFDISILEKFLGLTFDKSIMKSQIRGYRSGKKLKNIPYKELKIIQNQVEPFASQLGYKLSV